MTSFTSLEQLKKKSFILIQHCPLGTGRATRQRISHVGKRSRAGEPPLVRRATLITSSKRVRGGQGRVLGMGWGSRHRAGRIGKTEHVQH